MKPLIQIYCFQKYNTDQANKVLNRSYLSMYFEWWAHNIGYYISKPFQKYQHFNLRCKDVDLEEWRIKNE
jgi:hypothetical protein